MVKQQETSYTAMGEYQDSATLSVLVPGDTRVVALNYPAPMFCKVVVCSLNSELVIYGKEAGRSGI